MRTLRLSLAVAATLALLGGSSGAVVAQADEEPGRPQPPTEMRATIDCGVDDYGARTDFETIGPMEGGSLVRIEDRGQKHRPVEVSVSDPRFGGEHSFYLGTYTFMGPGLADPGYGHELVSGTWRIENDAGAWQGSSETVFIGGSDSTRFNMVLTGEGTYEGLSAIWVVDFDVTCRWTIRGLVFEGEMPPVPEAR